MSRIATGCCAGRPLRQAERTMAPKNRYAAIIEAIFHGRYEAGDESVDFHRDQITSAALSLGVAPPRNLGDVIYTFRYRQPLPASIRATAPQGRTPTT